MRKRRGIGHLLADEWGACRADRGRPWRSLDGRAIAVQLNIPINL